MKRAREVWDWDLVENETKPNLSAVKNSKDNRAFRQAVGFLGDSHPSAFSGTTWAGLTIILLDDQGDFAPAISDRDVGIDAEEEVIPEG